VISRDTSAAKEVVASSRNGFPWQASVGASVEEFEFIKDNQKATVNGQELTGPVNVVRKATLGEISFVDLGADGRTSASIAAQSRALRNGARTRNSWNTRKKKMARKNRENSRSRSSARSRGKGAGRSIGCEPGASAMSDPVVSRPESGRSLYSRRPRLPLDASQWLGSAEAAAL